MLLLVIRLVLSPALIPSSLLYPPCYSNDPFLALIFSFFLASHLLYPFHLFFVVAPVYPLLPFIHSSLLPLILSPVRIPSSLLCPFSRSLYSCPSSIIPSSYSNDPLLALISPSFSLLSDYISFISSSSVLLFTYSFPLFTHLFFLYFFHLF